MGGDPEYLRAHNWTGAQEHASDFRYQSCCLTVVRGPTISHSAPGYLHYSQQQKA